MTEQVKEMRRVYSDFLHDVGARDSSIVVLEADLSSSMSTNSLKEVLGERYVNVGIMEAEMVGLAAGLSLQGFKPYLHTFGPFASRRVFDQVFISLAYAGLGATIIGSDAGVTAEMNGGTHMPFEDLGLMRLIPHATVFEVSDAIQFEAVLQQTRTLSGVTYIRTTRKQVERIYNGVEDFSKGFILSGEGVDLMIVTSGIFVAPVMRVANRLKKEGYSIGVVDLFRVKPMDKMVRSLLVGKSVLTVENHNVIGGLGSAVSDLLSEDTNTPVYKMGIVEQFGRVGKQDYLLSYYGLDEDSIEKRARCILLQKA